MRILEGEAARKKVAALAQRYSAPDPKVTETVRRIIADVRQNGDAALLRYARQFDSIGDQPVAVNKKELKQALRKVPREFTKAVETAARNIRRYAEWQMPKSWMKTMQPGLRVGQNVEPIDSVGCYAPGGRYPLPSTVLMTVIPAQVAGVKRIAVASPHPAPETLAAAAILGVEEFYRIGGAQAVAAFAYGTESIAPVAKIVGPGNSYVVAAKREVAFDCGIDFLAGPTEIVTVAHKGQASYVASDLVAQAEHDPEALPVFVTSSKRLASEVVAEAQRQSAENEIAKLSLAANGVVLVARNRREAMDWANTIGGEHLTVAPDDLKSVNSAGSVFVGDFSPQSLGDYASGPNHTLPTGNVARTRSGLSVLDYVKIISVQQVSCAGLKRIGPTVMLLAEAEGLKAHANSVRVRLK
jgi:histidinol dehydrogenase